MEDRPRNLKAMLSEAKDTSELMVDLGYAALFFADAHMADEVHELEERLTGLIHEMREVCVLAARSKRDAEQMSSVLHVVSAIERMGNAAVDIAHIVTHRLGIPAALVADLGGRRRGVASRARARRFRAGRSLARSGRAADGDGHARRRDPARSRLDHRPRRRRDAAARRRVDPARSARGHRRSCASSQAHPSGSPPPSRRIPRSPTSTAPSTCSSR